MPGQAEGEHSWNTSAKFSASELQVQEYILEHEDQNENMAGIAENLGISKSALSKHKKDG